MAATPPHEKSLVVPDDAIYRLSVEQYHHMIRSGILTDDDPVELLEGWLFMGDLRHFYASDFQSWYKGTKRLTSG